MLHISLLKIAKPITILSLCAATSGCYLEVRESDKPEDHTSSSAMKNRSALTNLADPCSRDMKDSDKENDSSSDLKKRECFQKLDTVWRPSCRTEECQEVPVYVNYMLNEDLGGQSTVFVEAFDNPHFVGAPASSVQVGHFNTSRPGTYERTSIWLEPGAYYLRAFVSYDDSKTVPYQYQQMQLVSERPLGIFGALSSPAPLTVKPRKVERNADPVHILIDKLFRDPNAKVETKAHLRVSMTVPVCSPEATEPCTPVPESRTVIVRLFEDDDLQRVPVASFSMPSEAFLVSTRPGRAELLSPELPIGRYVVFAFVDENANQFHDDGELAQTFARYGAPALVKIEAHRTAELTLNLQRTLP